MECFPKDSSWEAPMSYNRILSKDNFATIFISYTQSPKVGPLKICTPKNRILNILTSLCWAVKLLNFYFWKWCYPFSPVTELLTGKTAKETGWELVLRKAPSERGRKQSIRKQIIFARIILWDLCQCSQFNSCANHFPVQATSEHTVPEASSALVEAQSHHLQHGLNCACRKHNSPSLCLLPINQKTFGMRRDHWESTCLCPPLPVKLHLNHQGTHSGT